MLKRTTRIMPILLAAMMLAVSVVPAFAVKPEERMTIVDVAIDLNSSGPFAGEFDLLIGAVLAADPAILETLSGNGQNTVFAPVDGAFEDLLGVPENEIDIDTIDKGFLTDVLLYHVAPGRRYSDDVLASDRIRTLLKGKDGFLGQSGAILTDNLGRQAPILLIDVDDDGYFDTIDIEADNGIIHAIGAVVLPYGP